MTTEKSNKENLFKDIYSRPGLSRIDYRLGTYSTFRDAFLKLLNEKEDTSLREWTYRGPDDPAIAIMEGASILCDILAFYQNLHANEAYLRTARQRESITKLVQLTGYQPSPGLGGEGCFTVEVRGTNKVTIPAGFPIQAQLEEVLQIVDFETKSTFFANPKFNSINLYPRLKTEGFVDLQTVFWISDETPPKVKSGDRILVVFANPVYVPIQVTLNEVEIGPVTIDSSGVASFQWTPTALGQCMIRVSVADSAVRGSIRFEAIDVNGGFVNIGTVATNIWGDCAVSFYADVAGEYTITATFLDYKQPYQDFAIQTVIVDDFWEIHGKTFFKIKGALSLPNGFENSNGKIYAYLLGRSFHHFGHNAPPYATVPNSWGASLVQIKYDRILNNSTTPDSDLANLLDMGILPILSYDEFPLDVAVDDLSEGIKIVIESPDDESIFLIAPLKKIKKSSYSWGTLTGTSTVIMFGEPANGKTITGTFGSTLDIRKIQFHELLSVRFELRPEVVRDYTGESHQENESTILLVHGNKEENEELIGRELVIYHPENHSFKNQITHVTDPTDDEFLTNIGCSLVTLKSGFDFDDLDGPKEIGNPISCDSEEYTAYGNLLYATQGKTETLTILGSGDNRAAFQRFKLPKSPLTYLFSKDDTPSEVPELQIFVENRKWKRVPSLFNRKPKEEIFIVRQDNDDNSWVQFGDGKTGAKLPSGIDNVTAIYRTGTGAKGKLKEGTSVQLGGSVTNLDDLNLFTSVVLGSKPESGNSAREAAPGKLLGLDRLVSLRDYESEVLAMPGVIKTLALFKIDQATNTPIIKLTVLMEGGGPDAFDEIEKAIREYDKFHGPQRYPIEIIVGEFEDIEVDITYYLDPLYRKVDVEEEIRDALGVYDSDAEEDAHPNGLFSLSNRTFGENEYMTTIAASTQNVPGVLWVKINSNSNIFPCDSNQILRLANNNLTLTKGG